MNVREYLGQIKKCEICINQKIKEREKARKQITFIQGIRYDRDKVQTSPKDSMSDLVVKLISIDEDVLSTIEYYTDLMNKIIRQIQALENAAEISILFDVYVESKDLMQIADEMHLSYSRVAHIHTDGLQHFEEKFLKVSNK